MKRLSLFCELCVLCVLCVAFVRLAQAPPARALAAAPQQTVVLYCSADQDFAEPIVKEFEKQTGIRVLARYDTEATKTVGLVQRLRSEAAKPSADVFWSGEIFHTIRLAREGLLAGTPVPDKWPGPADAKGRWCGFALRARVIAYNTNRVKPADAPRKLEDLLDAKWKGRIVLAQPQFGTTGGDVASWFAHYGSQRGRKILEALKANQVRLVQANSTAVRAVAQGEADLCFTDTDDIYAAQREKWPVAMNYEMQGDDGVLVIPNTVAVVKGAPHAEAARKLAAYLLSPAVEEALAKSDAHNTPVDPATAAKFPQYAIPKPLKIDYEAVSDKLDEAIAASREVFR